MSDEIRIERMNEAEAQDELLTAAMRNFRQSVHAWSDAEFARPRAVVAVHPRVRRPWAIASCALGIAVVIGVGGVGIHERNVQAEQARMAAQKQAEQQRELAAQKARESEDLLANVDKDVSREVPSALEPLAQLMDDGTE